MESNVRIMFPYHGKYVSVTKTEEGYSSLKSGKPHMTEQLIAPPTHIWDNIEKALDQQELRRKQGTEIITATLKSRRLWAGKKFYYIAAAGGLILGAVLLLT